MYSMSTYCYYLVFQGKWSLSVVSYCAGHCCLLTDLFVFGPWTLTLMFFFSILSHYWSVRHDRYVHIWLDIPKSTCLIRDTLHLDDRSVKVLSIVIDIHFKFKERLGIIINNAVSLLFMIFRAVICTDPFALVVNAEYIYIHPQLEKFSSMQSPFWKKKPSTM